MYSLTVTFGNDHFKLLNGCDVLQVCGEKHRFETLMHYFKNYEEFHIDFMVSRSFLPHEMEAFKLL